MRFLAILLISSSVALLLTNCEDPVEVPSQFESPQLVVDAWLRNDLSPQTIILSQTVDYFQGGQAPIVVNATVQVCNTSAGQCHDFLHEGGGQYRWRPGGTPIGQVGDDFSLSIELDGNNYSSTTTLNRTARLDSIGVDFEEESIQFPEDGFYAQLYAFDPEGRGDTYWVRAYKNDTLLNKNTELTVVYDATFDAGADVDGTYFIPPLRYSINPLDEDDLFVPFRSGDRIVAEVHSISNAAFNFLNIAGEQITNEGIFAVPIANAPSNIFNDANGDRALGIFNVAEVAVIEKLVD